MLKIILPGIGVFFALIGFLIFSGKIPLGNSGEQAKGLTGELEMWGTLPSESINPILQNLGPGGASYSVSYVEIPVARFNDALLNALASGRGPDLILTDYQTILAQSERIYPFPSQSFSVNDYRNAYVDGASIFLTGAGPLAFPVSVEPMVLFMNRTLFSKAGIAQIPITWDDVIAYVPQLTTTDRGTGRFVENGIALGTTNNVSHAKDMAMALVEELRQLPVTPNGTSYDVTANTPIAGNESVYPLTSTVQLLTQFSNPRSPLYTWNVFQDDAKTRFISGNLAMYIGYSGEYPEIIRKNPRLDVGIAMFPQAKGYNTNVTSMKLYGIATLRRTQLLQTALTAQANLAGAQYGPQIALAAGGVTPLKSIIATNGSLDEGIKKSVLVARGWYDVAPTLSTQYFARMIDDILTGRKEAVEAAEDFMSDLTSVYKR